MSQQIAEELLGQIDWVDSTSGFCACPGIALHTGGDSPRDCQVFIEGAPTIHCFHDSCSGIVAEANLKLRRAIGSNEAVVPFNTGQYVRQKKKEHAVSSAARKLLARILEQPWEPEEMWESSPYRLDGDPTHDWRRLLGLFRDSDTIWIGDIKDSGSPIHAANFRTVSHWLKGGPEAPAQFTCPATFKSTSYSRSKANILSRPYLVVESDTLSKPEIGAVFRWLNKLLPLYAVVDTGGKSLHGWFQHPPEECVPTLKQVLTELQCDRKMFSESQPCRLPGAKRSNRFQSLLFFSPDGHELAN